MRSFGEVCVFGAFGLDGAKTAAGIAVEDDGGNKCDMNMPEHTPMHNTCC